MKTKVAVLGLLLIPGVALAIALAETLPTSKSQTGYLNATSDAQTGVVRVPPKTGGITPPVTTTPPASAKMAVGVNLSGHSWYSSRQAFTNLLQGGQWNVDWKNLTADQLTPLGYPKVWPATGEYKRLVGAPTGGWVRQTSIACSWKGTGTLVHNGGLNQKKGDHTLAFDMPSWNGAVRNTWFSLWGVKAADPFRDFECHDANPANASGHEFSKEIVESTSKYQVLRFMDWNATNASPVRSWATRPDPRTLENPSMAIENQFRLAKLADADVWFNHSWKDDASYIAGSAKYAHDNLPAGHKVYIELSNEVWNWQFQQAHDNLAEATALKINPNNGYGAWQNYSRRSLAMFKIWEAAFADRPKDLVRVLGTQVAYAEVTRQEMSYPGIVDHVDAIAGAPYFSHDRTKPYTNALLEADIASTLAYMKTTCDIARAKAPNIRCITYEGGQHELPTAWLPQNQFEKLQRSQFMGDTYYKYLKAFQASPIDLVVLFNDVDAMSKYGAWGQQEYGGQTNAPKQLAVDRYLKE